MKDFKGRVAVVTGGASGVGLALARAFLGAGMKVAIADVEAPALARAREALAAPDGELLDVVCDVSKREAVDALAEKVYERFGACHVLCNNAGVSVPNLNVWDTTPNDWLWVHGVNVRGVANGVQAFVPRMLAAGEPGVVMNTSSGDGGLSPFSEQVVYASSKAAVSILTECLHAQTHGAEHEVARRGFLSVGRHAEHRHLDDEAQPPARTRARSADAGRRGDDFRRIHGGLQKSGRGHSGARPRRTRACSRFRVCATKTSSS